MKRLLVVQASGDFREVHLQRQRSGVEYQFGQIYMLDELNRIARRYGQAGILSCAAPRHVLRLPTGVTLMGAGAGRACDTKSVLAMVADYDPTHLVVQAALPKLIRWGVAGARDVACVLTRLPAINPVARHLGMARLPAILNDRGVSLVAGHTMSGAKALVDMGVAANKVVPWDFVHERTPHLFAAKQLPDRQPHRLLYVGRIDEKKGVGDLIRALALLKGRRDVHLEIIGQGHIDKMQALGISLGLFQKIRFLGQIPNYQIPARMNAADAVIMADRATFPMGLPLTVYEALVSRTPIIASHRPLLAGHFTDRENALLFRAGNPKALADAIDMLLADQLLYARISRNAMASWTALQRSVKWGQMLDRWMSGAVQDRAWLAAQSYGVLMAKQVTDG